MVVLVSPDSSGSLYQQREIEFAHGSRRFSGRLIPVLLRETKDYPWIFERLQFWSLARCSWFVVVLTPQSVASQWVKHELVYALQDERYRGALSWTLSSLEFVDFRNGFEGGCREFLAVWKLNYRPGR